MGGLPIGLVREMHNMDRRSMILGVCTAAENILSELPKRKSTSRDAFFEVANLWRLEVHSTCSQIIEHYRGILLLIDQGLPRPAAALSRSIHEAFFRFYYLADNEYELRDWTEWQLNHDYYTLRDSLQYDTDFYAETKRAQEENLKMFESLLGGSPKRRLYPWRDTSTIFRSVARNLPDGVDKKLQRILIGFSSGYVHIRKGVEPPAEWTEGSAETSILSAIQRSMEVCRDKGLLSHEADEVASGIVTICGALLDPT